MSNENVQITCHFNTLFFFRQFFLRENIYTHFHANNKFVIKPN